MRKAVCPGSFDPVTNGHLDVFARAAHLADEVVILVAINKNKSGTFSIEERMDMLREVVSPYPNIKVDSFMGLLVDYCKTHQVQAIVKGLRAVTDFDGPDELPTHGHRDPVRLHEPHLQLPVLESDQRGGQFRWRHRRSASRSSPEAPTGSHR